MELLIIPSFGVPDCNTHALSAMLCLMRCFESDKITITTVTKARTLSAKGKKFEHTGLWNDKTCAGLTQKKGFSPKKKWLRTKRNTFPGTARGKKGQAKAKLKKAN